MSKNRDFSILEQILEKNVSVLKILQKVLKKCVFLRIFLIIIPKFQKKIPADFGQNPGGGPDLQM